MFYTNLVLCEQVSHCIYLFIYFAGGTLRNSIQEKETFSPLNFASPGFVALLAALVRFQEITCSF